MKPGIIGAMDVEVASIRAQMKDTKVTERAGMKFCEGMLGTLPAVVVQSGVGKVNAGMCVQILADFFQVTHIINTGVAGSLDNRINIGDFVISEDAMYHDVDATVFGYQPGEVPQLGMVSFPADSALAAAAGRACAEAAPDVHTFLGRIVSGDQFICERSRKTAIASTFHGMCCEMEGAAVAQACTLNRIPFVILRAISDKADESVQVSYDDFEAKAARDSARIVLKLAQMLGSAE